MQVDIDCAGAPLTLYINHFKAMNAGAGPGRSAVAAVACRTDAVVAFRTTRVQAAI